MDLEQAAHAAVTMMRQLLVAVADARSRCGEALATVGALAGQLDTDRAALDHALTAMQQQMTDLAASLSTSLTDVEPKVASIAHATLAIVRPDAASTTATTGSTAWQALDDEARVLDELASKVGDIEPHLDAMVHAAETAGQAALARADALEEALRDLLDRAEQRVSIEYGSFVSSLRDATVERGDQVQALMEKASVALLEDRGRDWEEKRRACEDVLERLFHDLETHRDALVTEALDACGGRVAQAMADLSATVGLVETGWLDLENTLDSAAGCLDTTPPLPERLADLAQTAHRAAEGVVAVRDAWRRQGFGG